MPIQSQILKNDQILACTRACNRFNMLESLFTRIQGQKLRRFMLKILKIVKLYGF